MARKHLPDRLGREPKPGHMRQDTPDGAARVRALAKRIAEESRYVIKPYQNSQGRVILNVIDPKCEVAPFVVRDEAEWMEKRPRKDESANEAREGALDHAEAVHDLKAAA